MPSPQMSVPNKFHETPISEITKNNLILMSKKAED